MLEIKKMAAKNQVRKSDLVQCQERYSEHLSGKCYNVYDCTFSVHNLGRSNMNEAYKT